MTQAGGNSLETEISSAMAQGGRKEYQVLSSLHDPQALHQSHYKT
jgi:hypothetical protein